jgi:regulator of protease activity HflC (stomatin/prohibitin superfamily)
MKEGAMSEIPTSAPTIAERPANRLPGGFALLLALVLLAGGIVVAATTQQFGWLAVSVVGLIMFRGLFVLPPGVAAVIQFFGRYTGTVRTPGLHFVNPLSNRQRLSVRIRNHETAVAKVNDAEGNPIEMAVVVVWQIEDTARAAFEVDDFVRFVGIQTETAVRHIATSYPYDNHTEDERLSLRENAEEITAKLSAEIAERVRSAGVRVIESRLTHLAYAAEIAGAMLQRQQAGAVVAARQRIVEGAVGMVELALARLAERGVVELDEERKAAMVSNLLVVLCGDRATQPVVNAGTLY